MIPLMIAARQTEDLAAKGPFPYTSASISSAHNAGHLTLKYFAKAGFNALSVPFDLHVASNELSSLIN
jgi:hypothetical protein